MEADWSVELAAVDPVIAVPWEEETTDELRESRPRIVRFIDHRGSMRTLDEFLDEIEEARERPALRAALAILNSASSKLWTAKCDAWENSPGSGGDPIGAGIDPLEMDASREEAIFSAGSYIDLLLCDDDARGSFEIQERWIRRLSTILRGIPLRCARTDFVLRRAEIQGTPGFGVTWFVESCGASPELARLRWAEALVSGLPVLMDDRCLYSRSREGYNCNQSGE